jgi:phosphoserine phosphatase
MSRPHDKPIVAVVFDFDDTLAPESTSQLLEALGLDVPAFWRDDVEPLVGQGWDPVQAYLHSMLEASRAGRLSEPLSRESIERVGREAVLYPGVETLFGRLREELAAQSAELALEFYVISSGLERLVAATPLRGELTQLWGCEFDYAEDGRAQHVRNVVSFTDKTRYLFQIEKGLIAPRGEVDPFAVNQKIPPAHLRVPFAHMIYVGDGYTDVPCFSLVAERGGIPLAVVDPERYERWGRAWGFIEEGRAMNLCPTDFSPGGSTEMTLRMALQSVCDRVALDGRVYGR